MKTLKQVKVGETVKVVKLHGEGAVKRRIMDMGITKGVEVYVRKVAPLGDPVEVHVRGYELSIRKADAGGHGEAIGAAGFLHQGRFQGGAHHAGQARGLGVAGVLLPGVGHGGVDEQLLLHALLAG